MNLLNQNLIRFCKVRLFLSLVSGFGLRKETGVPIFCEEKPNNPRNNLPKSSNASLDVIIKNENIEDSYMFKQNICDRKSPLSKVYSSKTESSK